jgi:hypothetical protein
MQFDRKLFGLIEIVHPPEMTAPSFVSEAYVGLQLPCVYCHPRDTHSKDVITKEPKPERFSFFVLQVDAIAAVASKNPDVEKWYKDNKFPTSATAMFSFREEDVKVIKPVHNRTDFIEVSKNRKRKRRR